jgi:hypothetical protein
LIVYPDLKVGTSDKDKILNSTDIYVGVGRYPLIGAQMHPELKRVVGKGINALSVDTPWRVLTKLMKSFTTKMKRENGRKTKKP